MINELHSCSQRALFSSKGSNSPLQPPGHCSSLPRVRPTLAILLVLIGLAACEPEPTTNPVKEVFTASNTEVTGGAAVVFRFSSAGDLATLYRLPNLEEVSWRFELGGRRIIRTVGFASDDDLIYALAQHGNSEDLALVALDLATGRARTIDTAVTNAALGPTGNAYVIRTDGTVGQVEHRSTELWPDTLIGTASIVRGAARGRMLAVLESDSVRQLTLLGGRAPVRQTLPPGEIAVSGWGRMVVVAADSGLAIFDPRSADDTRLLPIPAQPHLLAFSASGHQLFVTTDRAELLILDRFSLEMENQMTLPGRAAALRPGALGRYLLAYSAEQGQMWVIDPVQQGVLATIECSWEEDLPTVAPDGSILARQRGNLVVLGGEGFEIIARGEAGANDRWLVTQWDPRRPALELARDSVPTEGEPDKLIYVQISSSRNVAWAQALADELSSAGLLASVLPADSTDELYRVVLGPFPTREEAEETARRLDRPSFIREIDRPVP